MSEFVQHRLEDVAHIIMGQSPDSSSCNEDWTGLPFLQGSAEFTDKYPLVKFCCTKPAKKAPKDSILISVRAPVGEVNLAEQDYCIGRGLGSIAPKHMPLELLYYLILLNKNKLQRVSQGSTFDAIGSVELKALRLDVPPVEEQRKIAKILSTVDSLIEKTQALIYKYQSIKQGMMHDLFTRGVDENGQLRPSYEEAPHLYKESELGWIPKEWEVKTTLDLAQNIPGSTTIGPFGSNLVASDYRDEGVPVVFVRDVKEDGFQWKSDVYVAESKALELSAHSVKPGDIVATKMGLPPCIACIYPKWMPNGVITADIVRLRPDKRVDVEWLSFAINQHALRSQVQAITAGVTRPKVTLADFRELKLACPGLSEQGSIAARLQSLTVKMDIENKQVSKLLRVKAGLMQDLLTGKVRVKVDA